MKSLVMAVIFAANGLVSFATGMTDKFAYNYQVDDDNRVTSELVYKSEGKYLKHHLKYDYTYDEAGRVVEKEAFKWNDIRQAYQPYYCMTYAYDAEGVALEYAAWDGEAQAYSAGRQRAVYNLTGAGLLYQAYEWDALLNGWQLLADHSLEGNTPLLADR